MSASTTTQIATPPPVVQQHSNGLSSSGSSSTSNATSSSSSHHHHENNKSKHHRPTMGPALASGVVQAVLFNPLDRALYLRVINKRDLWVMDNFKQPFQGFANAAIYRTISGASYLVLQDYAKHFLQWMYPSLLEENPHQGQITIGLLAGAVNGFLLNQMQIIKFYCWSTNGTFWATAKQMRQEGGNKIFFRGVSLSISRDIVFGIGYEMMRMPHVVSEYGDSAQFFANTMAGMSACVFSAPINYCRNIVYATPASNCPLSSHSLLLNLWSEMQREATPMKKVHLMNSRLNVGWGSLRVGLGFGVGQLVFSLGKKLSEDPTKKN